MNRRLKIAHITEGFDGGVVTFLRQVLPAQCARGLDVSLICSPRHPEQQAADLELLARAGVNVHLLRMTRRPALWRDMPTLLRLVGLLRRERFDLVHTHCFKAGLLARLAARIANRPVVVHTAHCWPFLRADSPLANWPAAPRSGCWRAGRTGSCTCPNRNGGRPKRRGSAIGLRPAWWPTR